MASNLLLVDESPLIHRVVELTMEGLDISVYSAEDTEEALTLARSLKPDFILASTTFKRNSGFDLCRAFKEDADLAAIPVLLLASAKEEVNGDEAVAAGAIGVLTKPFEPESLLAEVEKALAGPSGGDEAAAAAEPSAEEPLAEGEENIFDEIEVPSELDEGAGAGDAPLDFEDMDEDLMDESLGEDVSLEIPPPEAGEAAAEESTPDAPAEAVSTADEEGGLLADMGLDEFLDEFDEGEEESADEVSGKEELDPAQLAIEDTLADDFASIGEENEETGVPEAVDSEAEAPESDAGEAAPSTSDTAPEADLDEDIDATLLAAENALADELESLAEGDASPEDGTSGVPEVESLLTDLDDPPGLEEAEAELAALQSELAADFDAPNDVDEGGLEHLADDQVQAAEEELASLQEELSDETVDDPAAPEAQAASGTTDYGTSAIETEQFLDKMEFHEPASLEEDTGEAEAAGETGGLISEIDSDFENALEEPAPESETLPGETLETEDDLLDEAFWEQLEIEEESEHETPSESPKIFAIPQEEKFDEEITDSAPALETISEEEDAGTAFEEELISPLPEDFPLAEADEAAPVLETSLSGDAEGEGLATAGIQKSLERTVEAIVPALLRRIETMVVEQLPDMVEKIVIREIEKIKRGE